MDDTMFQHGSLPGWDVRVGVEPNGGHQRDPGDYPRAGCVPPFYLCLDGL